MGSNEKRQGEKRKSNIMLRTAHKTFLTFAPTFLAFHYTSNEFDFIVEASNSKKTLLD